MVINCSDTTIAGGMAARIPLYACIETSQEYDHRYRNHAIRNDICGQYGIKYQLLEHLEHSSKVLNVMR